MKIQVKGVVEVKDEDLDNFANEDQISLEELSNRIVKGLINGYSYITSVDLDTQCEYPDLALTIIEALEVTEDNNPAAETLNNNEENE